MDLQEILEQASLLDYVSQYIELNLDNGEYWGLSPFKDEQTPSFSVHPDKNVFKDFSSGKSGNIIDFICLYHKCSVREAILKLKEFLKIDDMEYTPPPQIVRELKKFKPSRKQKKPKIKHKILDDRILEKYEKRDIQEWEYEGIRRETYERYDVVYDPYYQTIVIPIYDLVGKLINLCLRTTDPNYKEFGIPKYIYKYELGVLDFFYGWYKNFHSIQKKKQIILVEGAKSVMKLEQWGYDNAIAILTSHLNEHQLKILVKYGFDVVVAFDKDAEPYKDENIQKLKRFCKVFIIKDTKKLLDEKDSPCDKGLEIWERLYAERRMLK